MPSPIPAEVRRLIRAHLETMSHVDAIVALAGAAGPVTATELATETFMATSAATACLDDFVATGLAVVEDRADAPRRYTFQPRNPQDRFAVTSLVSLRNTKPVSLVRFVYERPMDLFE